MRFLLAFAVRRRAGRPVGRERARAFTSARVAPATLREAALAQPGVAAAARAGARRAARRSGGPAKRRRRDGPLRRVASPRVGALAARGAPRLLGPPRRGPAGAEIRGAPWTRARVFRTQGDFCDFFGGDVLTSALVAAFPRRAPGGGGRRRGRPPRDARPRREDAAEDRDRRGASASTSPPDRVGRHRPSLQRPSVDDADGQGATPLHWAACGSEARVGVGGGGPSTRSGPRRVAPRRDGRREHGLDVGRLGRGHRGRRAPRRAGADARRRTPAAAPRRTGRRPAATSTRSATSGPSAST